MPWRPLHNIIFVEPDPIERYQGLIALPDKNSEEKISPYATIRKLGDKCRYSFTVGQRVVIERFRDKPFYVEDGGKKLRVINEDYIHAIVE